MFAVNPLQMLSEPCSRQCAVSASMHSGLTVRVSVSLQNAHTALMVCNRLTRHVVIAAHRRSLVAVNATLSYAL